MNMNEETEALLERLRKEIPQIQWLPPLEEDAPIVGCSFGNIAFHVIPTRVGVMTPYGDRYEETEDAVGWVKSNLPPMSSWG